MRLVFLDSKITEKEHRKNFKDTPSGELNKNRKAAGLPTSIALCKWILAINILNLCTVSNKIMVMASKTLSKY